MGLFYSKESKQQFLGYVDTRYISDPHKPKSQTDQYVFIVMEPLFHGDPLSRQWWPHHRIIQRL